MGSATPKQFLELQGKPLLIHTLERLHPVVDQVVVVLPEAHLASWQAMAPKLAHLAVAGGNSRSASVRKGLAALADDGVVAIHDGVRPLASAALLAHALKTAQEKGSAVPVLPITSSLRRREAEGSFAVDRSEYFEVQTPQCFRTQLLKAAYDGLGEAEHSDDATVFELAGGPVHLIEGEASNIKVTTPVDLKLAEALLVK